MTKTSIQARGLAAAALLAASLGTVGAARAQSRAETLRYVTGAAVNTLDPTMPGTTREAFAISLSTYDRLVTFGRKKLGDSFVFDLDSVRGELAERYEVSPDGLTLTFVLRPDAKFQDGTPVTAEDVKWSLDRAVSAKSLAAPQLLTGSLTSPDQFKVVDPRTFQVTLPKPDRLALPNLATVYAIIINARAAKAHATPEDPWAQGWLKDHAVGSGAYSVDVFKPGEQVVLRRSEAWTGAAPDKPAGFKRIIAQTIPDPATRANLVEKGDADIVIDLQANDAQALKERGKLKVIATPQFNALTLISFNTRLPPFDKLEVRQAVASALPYDAMFKAALFGRGKPLFGATWGEGDPKPVFPVPQPVTLDLDKARTLLAAAGLPDGFSTTFSFNLGQAATAEPMAALIRESLEKIGVKVEIQKLPDAQMSTQISEKKLPFFTEGIVAWLPSPDYFYRNFYTGNQRWNYSSVDDPVINELANKARFERDAAKYDEDARALNLRHLALMPQIPIWQPNQDAVMAPSVEGYTYQFHRQVDYRDLSRK
ncbi:ABC transporter substrate-binding protein [Methylobacterium crusticola]|uniref:ABC transporter substrate-binding protein n=1 Tax=Methylobacterium crusticola TaxID=1697972 RepID=UPI00387E96D5